MNKRIYRIQEKPILKTGGQNIFRINNGCSPKPKLQKKTDDLAYISKKCVQDAEKQAKTKAESLQQNKNQG